MTLFTHNLTRLDLYECQFDVRIKFPSSLETLRFIFCYQPDLLSYEYWDELTKLKTLNIDCNGLENLEGWKPPPNLTHLSLMGSKFEELKSTWPLFSSPSVTPKLIDLDFSHISLCEIDSDIQLPPCLEILHLSEERISEDLLFPASFKKPSLFITY
ncbi:uncharacterized protein RJT21DRAFT_115655 [Scheffersomyces amazonensis]|uniref:uncharacterized protein n=1 Tax=Scheffersomyces amazonensis TaxID=1078765 RepID=UPI00315CD998